MGDPVNEVGSFPDLKVFFSDLWQPCVNKMQLCFLQKIVMREVAEVSLGNESYALVSN